MQRPNSRLTLPGRLRLVRVVKDNVVAPALNHKADRRHALAGIVERPSSARGGAMGLRRGTFAIGAKVATGWQHSTLHQPQSVRGRNGRNWLVLVGQRHGPQPATNAAASS
jgi:hypothetical protein